jgi:hypothetical protein
MTNEEDLKRMVRGVITDSALQCCSIEHLRPSTDDTHQHLDRDVSGERIIGLRNPRHWTGGARVLVV